MTGLHRDFHTCVHYHSLRNKRSFLWPKAPRVIINVSRGSYIDPSLAPVSGYCNLTTPEELVWCLGLEPTVLYPGVGITFVVAEPLSQSPSWGVCQGVSVEESECEEWSAWVIEMCTGVRVWVALPPPPLLQYVTNTHNDSHFLRLLSSRLCLHLGLCVYVSLPVGVGCRVSGERTANLATTPMSVDFFK